MRHGRQLSGVDPDDGLASLGRPLRATLGSLSLMLLPAIAWGQNVALVVDRSGLADTVMQGAVTPVQVLAALPVGTRIRFQGTATVTLLYVKTGDEYTLTGPGESELRAAAPASDSVKMRRRITDPGRQVRLPIDNVTLAGIVMRSGGPRPLYPAGRVVARPARLVWSSLLGDSRFRVELRDAGGALLMQQQTTGLSLMLPHDVPLMAGQRYAWSVALADDEEATPAISDFEMAEAGLRATALRLKPAESAPFADRVVYGLWLEQAGANGEARQLWDALAKERPDEAAVLARSRR